MYKHQVFEQLYTQMYKLYITARAASARACVQQTLCLNMSDVSLMLYSHRSLGKVWLHDCGCCVQAGVGFEGTSDRSLRTVLLVSACLLLVHHVRPKPQCVALFMNILWLEVLCTLILRRERQRSISISNSVKLIVVCLGLSHLMFMHISEMNLNCL